MQDQNFKSALLVITSIYHISLVIAELVLLQNNGSVEYIYKTDISDITGKHYCQL